MVTVNNTGNNAQQPFNQDNAYLPDQLIAGVFPRVTANVTVLSGSQVNSVTPLPRGTVMGISSLGAATAVAGTNTGNGAISAVTLLKNAKLGLYTMTATVASTNSATFRLIDPAGVVLGDYAFNGSGAHLTVADQLSFTITDGTTDFVVGDTFNITVAAGTGKYKPSVATATDGSQAPVALLVDQTDPSLGDVVAGVYLTGEFNQNAMTFDASWTAATLTTPLRALSIFLKNSVTATDPS